MQKRRRKDVADELYIILLILNICFLRKHQNNINLFKNKMDMNAGNTSLDGVVSLENKQ